MTATKSQVYSITLTPDVFHIVQFTFPVCKHCEWSLLHQKSSQRLQTHRGSRQQLALGATSRAQPRLPRRAIHCAHRYNEPFSPLMTHTSSLYPTLAMARKFPPIRVLRAISYPNPGPTPTLHSSEPPRLTSTSSPFPMLPTGFSTSRIASTCI